MQTGRRPVRNPLRLLPSGPDRVGGAAVRRLPAGPISQRCGAAARAGAPGGLGEGAGARGGRSGRLGRVARLTPQTALHTCLKVMAIRPILTAPDIRLKQKSAPVEGAVSDEHRALMDDMLETMYAAPGIGLAAIQIGEPVRIIVMDLAKEGEEKQPRYFVNPEILWASEEMEEGTEGCLSIPGWVGDVSRHEAIAVKGLNRSGQKIKLNLEGWLARIFQHEIDHLDGVLYTDRLISPETLRRVTPGQEEAEESKAEAIG